MLCNNITCTQNIITNLSDRELYTTEVSVLSKGLSFIPSTTDIGRSELPNTFDGFRENSGATPKNQHQQMHTHS